MWDEVTGPDEFGTHPGIGAKCGPERAGKASWEQKAGVSV